MYVIFYCSITLGLGKENIFFSCRNISLFHFSMIFILFQTYKFNTKGFPETESLFSLITIRPIHELPCNSCAKSYLYCSLYSKCRAFAGTKVKQVLASKWQMLFAAHFWFASASNTVAACGIRRIWQFRCLSGRGILFLYSSSNVL